MANVKERILKAMREKQLVAYKEKPPKTISTFFIRNFAGQKGVKQYIQSTERKKLPKKNTLPQQNYHEGEIKRFPDNLKLKECITTKSALQEMLKGTS